MNTLASSAFAFSLPHGVAAGSAPAAGLSALVPVSARAVADGAPLLRAEVEPQARGLSVQAHAERVLAAMRPQG